MPRPRCEKAERCASGQSPIALAAYETLAEAYASRIDTKPHNAYYERPATLSLLPEVKGKRVLDAGCGPGVYTEWLADHGAEVVALDVSPKMVELAKKRVGTKATVLQADISQPLHFFQDGCVEWERRGFGIPVRVPAYSRPLGAVLNPLLEVGFILERILEPTPTEQFKQEDPEGYEQLSRRPEFLCIRAAKR